jgi:hypothetical protein
LTTHKPSEADCKKCQRKLARRADLESAPLPECIARAARRVRELRGEQQAAAGDYYGEFPPCSTDRYALVAAFEAALFEDYETDETTPNELTSADQALFESELRAPREQGSDKMIVERDDARRELCELLDKLTEVPQWRSAREVASQRGWDYLYPMKPDVYFVSHDVEPEPASATPTPEATSFWDLNNAALAASHAREEAEQELEESRDALAEAEAAEQAAHAALEAHLKADGS